MATMAVVDSAIVRGEWEARVGPAAAYRLVAL